MHFFGHNINSVHASDDLQVFKIPYVLEDTSLIMQKLHGVRQCSRPQWCSSSMPTQFTSVAISSWTNILEQDRTHQPFHSFAHVSCKASSCVQAPTCQGCNFSKKSAYFRHTLPLRLARSSIIYPSSHKHGSEKWVPPIIVTFHFSLFMFMGGRVSVSYPCFRSRLFRSSQLVI